MPDSTHLLSGQPRYCISLQLGINSIGAPVCKLQRDEEASQSQQRWEQQCHSITAAYTICQGEMEHLLLCARRPAAVQVP